SRRTGPGPPPRRGDAPVIDDDDVLIDSEEARSRERAWLLALQTCQCRRPVPDRVYHGERQCAACLKPTNATAGGAGQEKSRERSTTGSLPARASRQNSTPKR